MNNFDLMSLVYMIALLVFIGPGVLSSQRSFAHGLRNLLIWVIIGLALAIFYKTFIE